jgi:multiple sugar transport system substrate-binding protein
MFRRKEMRRLWLLALILIIPFTQATGAGQRGRGDGQIELRISWWGNEARHNATLDALDVFMRRHPHIRVSAEYQGFDGYHEKLITQMASGTQPDVSQVDNNVHFADLAANGRLTDLAPYIGTIINLEQYSRDGLMWGQFNGRQYGIPTGFNGPVLFYNKLLLDRAGLPHPQDNWTWEQYEDVARRLNAQFPNIYGFREPGSWHIMTQTRQHSGGWFANPSGELLDFSRALGQVFTTFNRWRREGIMPPIELSAAQNTQQHNLFLTGRVAFQVQHIAQLPMDQAAVAEGAELGVAMFPGSAQLGGAYVLASMPLTIGTNSRHKEEAAALINFLINDVEAARLLTTQRGVPGSNIARTAIEPYVQGPGRLVIDGINSLLAHTTRIDYEWRVRGGQVIADTLIEEAEITAYGRKTPEQAAIDAHRRILASVSRAR